MKPINQRFDRFDLLAEVTGADGATQWLGASGRGGRVVTIKRFHPQLTGTEALSRLFRAEAEAASKLRFPTVISILDAGARSDGHYVALEHVEGELLGRLVSRSGPRGGTPLRVAIRIALDVLGALGAIHTHPGPEGRPFKLLHRSVSTSNLLVGTDGVTRVAEVTVGSQGGGAVEDLYACAVALWESIAGRRLATRDPSAGSLPVGAIMVAPRLDSVRSEVPAEIADVIAAALHRDPARRPGRAEAFAAMLEAAASASRMIGTHADVAAHLDAVVGAEVVRQREEMRALLEKLEPSINFPKGSDFLASVESPSPSARPAVAAVPAAPAPRATPAPFPTPATPAPFPRPATPASFARPATPAPFVSPASSVTGAPELGTRGRSSATDLGSRGRSSATDLGSRGRTSARRLAGAPDEKRRSAPIDANAAVAAAAAAHPEPTMWFGKYGVIRHLADGGMAEVYLARATGIEGFEKTVVIKRLKEELASNSTATELFLQEARIAATLEHPQIAQVYDVGEDNGSYFFAMEYVQGQDLSKLMNAALRARREVPLEDALRVITELCGALHYAHEKHGPDGEHLALVHRDVSPSNVLMSYDGVIKLCDFGVAEVASARRDPKKRVVAGKLSYMSPEQCRGDALDRRSDIFVLAIVLYELTTLTKLFKGKNDQEVARQIVEGRVRPPSAIRANYPPELERIIMKGLAVRPSDRYATAQQMRLDLEAFGRENKLALSEVRIAELMTSLFPPSERGDDAPAVRTGSELGFAPVVSVHAPRAWYGVWAVAALLAAAAGGATFAIDGARPDPKAKVSAALTAAGDRVSSVLSTQLRGARSRVDAAAVTPMLRAAIGTDTDTVRDMMNKKALVSAGPGEVFEGFNWEGKKATTLLRVPADAAPLEPVRGGVTRLVLAADGSKLVVTASAQVAPLYEAKDLDGSIVFASGLAPAALSGALPPDLAGVQLRGLSRDLALGAPATFESQAKLTVPVPLDAAWQVPPLTLEAPVPTMSKSEMPPIRAGAFGAAGVFALLFLVGRRRNRYWRS